MIRGALILGTGFALGTIYTLRNDTVLAEAIGELRDEFVKTFYEQEDPEPLKKLLEYTKNWDDEDGLIALGPDPDAERITAGDIRSLSVHFEPTETLNPSEVINAEFHAWSGIDRETRRALTNAIEKMRDAPDDYPAMVANEAGDALLTMGQLRTIHKAVRPDNIETPKENTSP